MSDAERLAEIECHFARYMELHEAGDNYDFLPAEWDSVEWLLARVRRLEAEREALAARIRAIPCDGAASTDDDRYVIGHRDARHAAAALAAATTEDARP